MCRYGHQDVYRVLGRDPEAEPLSILEEALFAATLEEHVIAEFNPKAARAIATGHPGID